MSQGQRRLTYIIAVGLGLAFATCTAMIAHLGFLGENLGLLTMALLMPGVLCSIAIAQNAHAFPLSLAAVANFFFYFCFTWCISLLISKFRRKRKAS